MAFNNTVLREISDLHAGEVIKSAPYDVQAYPAFEEGLIAGRFARIVGGEVKNLDGTATPKVIGIPYRKIAGEIASTATYTKLGTGYDSAAEVIEFGYATVEISAAADPKRHDAVNIVNADADAENGKATEETVKSGIIASGGCVFWEPKGKGVWLIRFNKYIN